MGNKSLVKQGVAPLDYLAGRINEEHEQFLQAFSQGLGHAKAAGEMLLEAKAKVPHGGWISWVEGHCRFSRKTAWKYMRIAEGWAEIQLQMSPGGDISINQAVALLASSEEVEGSAEVVEGEIVEPSPPAPLPEGEGGRQRCARLSNPNPSDEHGTPEAVVQSVLAVLGRIELDPCSNSLEDPWVPAGRHFTREQDGLQRAWHSTNAYVNPPYSGGQLLLWAKKFAGEYRDGDLQEGLLLVPVYTDTGWWELLCEFVPMVCFFHGRLSFRGNREAARFPSAMLYFGPNCDRFYWEFAGMGRVFQEVDRNGFGSGG